MGPMTQGTRRLPARLAALLLAWRVAPAVVPICGGVGNPDEPCRYVSPPHGRTGKAPTVAKAAVSLNGAGLSAAACSSSGAQGAQGVLYIPAGSLKAPGGAPSS